MPGVVRYWGPYLYRSAFHATHAGARSPSARSQHLRDVIMVEGAQTIAAIILETVVGTNGILVPPPGYLAGVRADLRRVRHRHDRRRGDGRIRPLRRVVRRRPLGRDARPDHLREGRELRLRAARRSDHLRRDRRDVRRSGRTPAGSPTRATRWPARARSRPSTIFKDEEIVEHARDARHRRHRPRRWPRSPTRHPSVGEVRGLGVFWALELVRDRETREPLVPFNAAGAAAAADERVRRRVQAARAVAVHPLQPHARRAAVHDDRGRGARGAGHPRRGARRRRLGTTPAADARHAARNVRVDSRRRTRRRTDRDRCTSARRL